mgnify:CR=1 FL=1
MIGKKPTAPPPEKMWTWMIDKKLEKVSTRVEEEIDDRRG